MLKNKYKLHIILNSLLKSIAVISLMFLFWLIERESLTFFQILKFIFPYYLLWFFLMIISVIKRGKSFRIIWIASLREDETFSESNLPYAIIFIIGSLLILYFQWCIDYQ